MIILSKGIEGWGGEERAMRRHISTLGQRDPVFPEEARLQDRGPNKGE